MSGTDQPQVPGQSLDGDNDGTISARETGCHQIAGLRTLPQDEAGAELQPASQDDSQQAAMMSRWVKFQVLLYVFGITVLGLIAVSNCMYAMRWEG